MTHFCLVGCKKEHLRDLAFYEGTLLEGILIHDEGNNIIYQFEFSFGKNEEVLKTFSSIKK